MNYPYEALVMELQADRVSTQRLQMLLHHESSTVRVNALESIARQALHQPNLLHTIKEAVRDPKNGTLLLGTISIAHVGVAALLRVGSPEAVEMARQLTSGWEEPDKTDLLWYLESEGLMGILGKDEGGLTSPESDVSPH